MLPAPFKILLLIDKSVAQIDFDGLKSEDWENFSTWTVIYDSAWNNIWYFPPFPLISKSENRDNINFSDFNVPEAILKIEGVACEVSYEKGLLALALMRVAWFSLMPDWLHPTDT